MISRARLRYLGTSDQKARLVVNEIRGKGVGQAISALHYMKKGIARDIEKLLKSAVANAEQRSQRLDVDQLYVARAYVDRAPAAKRLRHRAMGRVFRILKRSCHVTLELDLRPRG